MIFFIVAAAKNLQLSKSEFAVTGNGSPSPFLALESNARKGAENPSPVTANDSVIGQHGPLASGNK